MSIIIIADLFILLCISSHLLCHNEHMVIFFLPSSYHSRTSHKHIHHIYPNKEDAGAKRSMLYTRVCVCVCVCVCLPPSQLNDCLFDGSVLLFLSKLMLCNPALTLQNVFCYLKSHQTICGMLPDNLD